MNKSQISVKLNSYSLTAQITALVLSLGGLGFIIPYIANRAAYYLGSGDIANLSRFSFWALSLFSLAIPSALLAAVLKTLIVGSVCRISGAGDSFSVMEANRLSGKSRVKSELILSDIKELVLIQIRQDEDGIANQYHLYAAMKDRSLHKVHTFSKYHFALRFGYEMESRTDLEWNDRTEQSFESETDFAASYVSGLS